MRPENSESQFPFDPGDVLDRATQALRQTPTPDGPSLELIARTQATLRREQTNNRARLRALLFSTLSGRGRGEGFFRGVSFYETDAIAKNRRPSPLPEYWEREERGVLPQGYLAGVGRGAIFFRPSFLRIAALIAVICGLAAMYWAVSHRDGRHGVSDLVRTNQTRPDGSKPLAIPNPKPEPNSHSPSLALPPTPTPAPEKHQDPPAPPAPMLADGVLAGRIVFDGVAPSPRPLLGFNMMPECAKVHGGAIYDESLVVGSNGALANVVVSVSDGLSGWLREEYPPPSPAVLDQRGCVFEPHVVPVMVGQQLSIRNSDPFLHNVHVMAVNNPQANLGQPTISESATAPFESPEVFQIKCDVHPWMQAWVRVVDNPFFAVTGRDGRFSIRGLPPGTYTLKAWHEQLGVREQQIVITPGEGTAADFTFHAGRGVN